MVERSLSNPRSLIGATPEELLTLKPDGWLVRPMPTGGGRFRLLEPAKLPGSKSVVSIQGRGSQRDFGATRVEPWLFVLNEAAEQPLLPEILTAWLPGGESGSRQAAIPPLAAAAQQLARDHLIKAYLDPLTGDALATLRTRAARRALSDPLNWWRDEHDPGVPPATCVIGIQITKKGEAALAGKTAARL